MNNVFAKILVACALVLTCAVQSEESNVLTVAVNSPGTPPHLYFNQSTREYAGVIPDLLRFAQQRSKLVFEFVDSHRNRNEVFVSTGKFDMFYASTAWLSQPEAFIATIPIFDHVSYLYSLVPFPKDFALNTQTKARICTRRGFVYPELDPFFENGNLIRIDSDSHNTMMTMLSLGRCNMVEMNLKNAQAMFKDERFEGQPFYQSEFPTSRVPASLIMTPTLEKERDQLNQIIADFKAAGLYEVSLTKHLHD